MLCALLLPWQTDSSSEHFGSRIGWQVADEGPRRLRLGLVYLHSRLSLAPGPPCAAGFALTRASLLGRQARAATSAGSPRADNRRLARRGRAIGPGGGSDRRGPLYAGQDWLEPLEQGDRLVDLIAEPEKLIEHATLRK